MWVHTTYAPLAEEACSVDNREYLMRLSDGSEHRCGRTYAGRLGRWVRFWGILLRCPSWNIVKERYSGAGEAPTPTAVTGCIVGNSDIPEFVDSFLVSRQMRRRINADCLANNSSLMT